MLLTGFCLGCIATIFLSVARDYRHLLVGKLFLGLLISATAYLIHDFLPAKWQWLAGDIMTILPALFWAICILGFSESPRQYKAFLPIALFSFVVPALTRPLGAQNPEMGLFHVLTWQAAQVFEFIVITHGVYVVLSGWKSDLVEQRRKMRGYLLFILGMTALVVTSSLNMGLGDDIPLVMVALCCVLCSYLILQTRQDVFEQAVISSTSKVDEATSRAELVDSMGRDENGELAQRLCDLMADGFYRSEKLTLRVLARKLDVPEYRLRKVINERFKYRNFNDYINQLRIEEASQHLINEPGCPIQNIALDVGYRTMSSFNRAFRDIQQCTPTEFRTRRLNSSHVAEVRSDYPIGSMSQNHKI